MLNIIHIVQKHIHSTFESLIWDNQGNKHFMNTLGISIFADLLNIFIGYQETYKLSKNFLQ